jgi:DsbC/DsbD-like thiol-disulfide interchange protein
LCAQQPKRPVADVTAVAPTTRLAPGREARLDLKVKLPAKVHVQSNKPSDPLFIPTVLTVDAPNGVTIAEIVYPPSEKLKQEGLKDPLIVFGSEFTLGVRVKIAADAKPGELIVPAKLRYQACDETTCYPPANATAKWSVQVGKS